MPSSGTCLLLFNGVNYMEPPQRKGFEEFNKQIEEDRLKKEEDRLKKEAAEKAAEDAKITINLSGDKLIKSNI